MKIFALLVFLCAPLIASAQGAYDPKCYFPRINEPEEIDTVHGQDAVQYFGSYLRNIGPAPSGGDDRLLFSGGNQKDPREFGFYEMSPFLDLHKLKKVGSSGIDFSHCVFAHLRSRQFNDAVVYPANRGFIRIFWQDANGNYDSSKVTVLRGDRGWDFFSITGGVPAILPLTQDTTDDIVAYWRDDTDSAGYVRKYACLYRGNSLFRMDTAWAEETKYFEFQRGQTPRMGIAGDFRGTGRRGFIASDDSLNGFYFANEKPAGLDEFVRSMMEDTLYVGRESELVGDHNISKGYVFGNTSTFPAFPKKPWDHSVDWVTQFGKEHRVRIFRGGPDFGNTRLNFLKPDFTIRTAFEIDNLPGGFAGAPTDCGDLTATGNHVMMISGSGSPGATTEFFYVTGTALDEQIDMSFTTGYVSGGKDYADSAKADLDKFTDVVIGIPELRTERESDAGKRYVGSVFVVHGSSKIPVRINPDMAVEEGASLASLKDLHAYPNPAKEHIALSIPSLPHGGTLSLLDLTGRTIFSRVITSTPTPQLIAEDISHLPAGSYTVVIYSEAGAYRARFIKQEQFGGLRIPTILK